MKNRLILLFAITMIIGSCSKDDNDDGSPGTNEVWMQNTSFKPSTITVAAGTTIKWTNKEGSTHTVTSNSNVFNSGNLTEDKTFSFKFDSAGTYAYHCTLHSGMNGTVVVN